MVSELESINEENRKLKSYVGDLKVYSESMRSQVVTFKAERKANKELVAVKQYNENTAMYKPMASAHSYSGYDQASEVQSYYEDLEARFGTDILPYKEYILDSKALKDATYKFTKVLADMGSEKTTRISEALDPAERKAIIESNTGVKITSKTQLATRMPLGWE
jgi:hypothetical protein